MIPPPVVVALLLAIGVAFLAVVMLFVSMFMGWERAEGVFAAVLFLTCVTAFGTVLAFALAAGIRDVTS